MRSIIGITASPNEEKRRIYRTNETYIKMILESNGIPLMIPAVDDTSYLHQVVQQLDALIIPGGADISPYLYDEEPLPQIIFFRKKIDLFEIELIKIAKELNKPVLGICRGAQLINVAFGGSLYQDLTIQFKNEICHRQSPNIPIEPIHKVYLTEGSHIAKIIGKSIIDVNSYHHQAVKEVAEGFKIVGKSKDGVVEAIESDDGMIIGVQWHPELLGQRFEEFRNLFSSLISY